MLRDLIVMSIMTFGLSRLLRYVIPRSVAAKQKFFYAHLGSLLLIALLYGLIVVFEPDVFGLFFIGVPLAAVFQGFWYYGETFQPFHTWRAAKRIQPNAVISYRNHLCQNQFPGRENDPRAIKTRKATFNQTTKLE